MTILPEELHELGALVTQAEAQRNKQSLTQLRHFVETHHETFTTAEGLSTEFIEKMLHYIANGNVAKKSELNKELMVLQEQLVGTNNRSVLDRLTCQEVLISFLLMRYVDTVTIRHFHHASALDIRKADYASTRFARSIKTLDKIRKALPILHNHVHFENTADGHALHTVQHYPLRST
jgi:hypothetical protein